MKKLIAAAVIASTGIIVHIEPGSDPVSDAHKQMHIKNCILHICGENNLAEIWIKQDNAEKHAQVTCKCSDENTTINDEAEVLGE